MIEFVLAALSSASHADSILNFASVVCALHASPCQDFNKHSGLEGKRISRNELAAMQLLIKLPEQAVKAIKYHFQHYKVHQSALPVSRLAAVFSADKNIQLVNPSSATWKDVFAMNQSKLEAMVWHEIGVFANNIKSNACLKKLLCCCVVFACHCVAVPQGKKEQQGLQLELGLALFFRQNAIRHSG